MAEVAEVAVTRPYGDPLMAITRLSEFLALWHIIMAEPVSEPVFLQAVNSKAECAKNACT